MIIDLGIRVLSGCISRGSTNSGQTGSHADHHFVGNSPVKWLRNQPRQVRRPSVANAMKLNHLSKAQWGNNKTPAGPPVVKLNSDGKAERETEQLCTLEKRGNIFFLNINGVGEHRMNPSLIQSIRSALSEVQEQETSGSALITTATGKFYCNGFDLEWAQTAGSSSAAKDRLVHCVELFKGVVADYTSLKMPTIAAVTGHAAAVGLMVPMSHDYVLMRNDRGVMYMSELDIGMTIPDYFMALLRSKVGSSAARRDVMLKGVKLKAADAVAMGLVDSYHDSPDAVLQAAVRLGEELVKRNWDSEVYAEIRKSLYPELCDFLGLTYRTVVNTKL